MSESIKNYFSELEQNDDRRLLLFYRFYNYPDLSLSGSEEENLKEYYNYGDIKSLVSCEGFFEFLNLCLSDRTFTKKLENNGLNSNLITKVRYIIFDYAEYRKCYVSDLEDEDFRDFFKGTKTLGKYSTKYNMLQLSELIQYFERCGWLYELEGVQDQNVSIELLNELKCKTTFLCELYHDIYVGPQIEEKAILIRIAEDNYEGSDSFLFYRNGFDKKTFKALVCNNEFLQICSNVLLTKDLPRIVIDNIISILQISIDFKSLNASKYENFFIKYDQLDEKRIKEFDLFLARTLITQFMKKRRECPILFFQ